MKGGRFEAVAAFVFLTYAFTGIVQKEGER